MCPSSLHQVGCEILANLADSDERAEQLFLAHPDIAESVESGIRGVEQTAVNELALTLAHKLLRRFFQQRLQQRFENQEKQLQAEKGKSTQMQRTIDAQASEIGRLKRRIGDLKEKPTAEPELFLGLDEIKTPQSTPQSKKPKKNSGWFEPWN
jgi:hypothetical protein